MVAPRQRGASRASVLPLGDERREEEERQPDKERDKVLTFLEFVERLLRKLLAADAGGRLRYRVDLLLGPAPPGVTGQVRETVEHQVKVEAPGIDVRDVDTLFALASLLRRRLRPGERNLLRCLYFRPRNSFSHGLKVGFTSRGVSSAASPCVSSVSASRADCTAAPTASGIAATAD